MKVVAFYQLIFEESPHERETILTIFEYTNGSILSINFRGIPP